MHQTRRRTQAGLTPGKDHNDVWHESDRKDMGVITTKCGSANGRMEATNNKVKLAVRMAYGFRNVDNLISTVFLRCGDLQIVLPGR